MGGPSLVLKKNITIERGKAMRLGTANDHPQVKKIRPLHTSVGGERDT